MDMMNDIRNQCGQVKDNPRGKITIENRGMKILGSIQSKIVNTRKKDAAYEARLEAKVRAGKKLTGEELNYIRIHMPELYAKAIRMMAKRQAVEQAFKSCKSKQEVDAALSAQMLAVGENDADREMLCNAIQEVAAEFKSSGAYKALPEKIQKEDEKYNINAPGDQNTETEYKTEFGTYQELYEREEREEFYATS